MSWGNKSDKLTAFATIVGVAVSGLAFALLLVQLTDTRRALNESRSQTRVTRFESVSARLLDLQKDLIADDRRRDYFFTGKPAPDESDTATWLLAARVVDTYEYIWFQVRELVADAPDRGELLLGQQGPLGSREDWAGWSESIASMFRSSPIVCKALAADAVVHSVDFYQAIRTASVCENLPDHPRGDSSQALAPPPTR